MLESNESLKNSYNSYEKKKKSEVKQIFFKIIEKLKSFFKNKVTKISILLIFSIILITIITKVFYNIYNNYPISTENDKKIEQIEKTVIKEKKFKKSKFYSDTLTVDKKISELKKSYEYYKNKATDKEKIVRWIDLYFNCVYVLNGRGKFGEFDCSYALTNYFWSFGSIMELEGVSKLYDRIQSLQKIGQIKQKNSRNAKTGDLLILKFGDTGHCGLVVNIKKGFIQFLDVNSKIGGMGLSQIEYKSKSVMGIYEMSFALWIGDSLKSN